jgi:hypothetical protein
VDTLYTVTGTGLSTPYPSGSLFPSW